MGISFGKFSGSGNDFIIIDNREGVADFLADPEKVSKICTRGLSVGADGLILIEKSNKADFKWRFYNGDGSYASMCGNGSRCAAKFAFMKGIAGANMAFETGAGIIEAAVMKSGEVKVLLTNPGPLERNINLSVGTSDLIVSFINTGVPHAVIFSEDVQTRDVAGLGRQVRYHGYFAPEGTNVNFVEALDGDSIRVRTYERGVEAETLACGTGSVASSIAAIDSGFVKSPVKVITSGGKILTVYYENGKAYLQGEARLVFTGELNAEAYDY